MVTRYHDTPAPRGRPSGGHRGRAAAWLAALLPLFLLPCGSAGAPVSGGDEARTYRIGSITLLRSEVFQVHDTTSGGWILDLANRVHTVTREGRIRSRLLFREGDEYDPGLVDESARILRSMGIVGDVEIRCDTLPGRIVDVTVVTNDRWALGLNTSFRRDGGITAYSLSVRDDNFIGNAQSISVAYNRSSERPRPHGVEVIFSDPHLLNEWWTLKAQYKSNDFLDIKTLLVERPLYRDAAEWSVGGYVDAGRSRVRTFADGALDRDLEVREESQRFWGILSSGEWPKLSLGSSYVRARTRGDDDALLASDNLDLVSVSLALMDRRYYRDAFVDNFGRVEDIPLGYHGDLVFGRNLHSSAPRAPRYYIRAGWQHALRPAVRWYLVLTAKLSGYIARNEPRDATVTFDCTQHVRLSGRHLLAMRSNVTLGENWSPGNQMLLGSPSGLRGYPAHGISGTRRAIVNIEHRFFPGYELWFFRFGAAFFVDSGMMWGEGDRFASGRLHSSAGVGLRIENAKQAGSGVVRVDLAFNVDERRFAELIVSSDHLFRAFRPMEHTRPTEDQ